MKKININLKKLFIFNVQLIIFIGIITSFTMLIIRVNILFNWFFLAFLYFINLLFTIVIYHQKRQTNAKMSWIYLILIFPVIGHAIFLTFGLMFINKYEVKLLNSKFYKIENHLEVCNCQTPENSPIGKLSKISKLKILKSNIDFYEEGYRFYQNLLNEIEKAQKSIFIVSYIIKKSEISNEFISILKRKIDQGVEIKWLVDDFGAMFSQKKELKKLAKLGAKVKFIGKIYYPFINAASFSRNHQKFIIIDSQYVFSGGNNISDEYASLSVKYGHWIDLNYKITGPYVNAYNLHFIQFWDIIAREKLEVNKYLIDPKIYHGQSFRNDTLLVSDSPSLNHSEAEYYWLQMFGDAKESIIISTPYFSLTNSLEKQMILALKRGVKIIIYIPGLPDKKLVYQVTLSQLATLIDHGLEVRVFKDHFLHSKIGLIDHQIAWVGTNNLDSRSMFSQYETMDVFYGNDVNKVAKIFENYDKYCQIIKNSHELKENKTLITEFLANWTKPLI
ncbi:phospholipase D-like domain-containing protein [Mycoplasmopsis gallopavonis]|nr:phospholipase D-like domain-containing protein [Mycoplasmopsis gallopavonis]